MPRQAISVTGVANKRQRQTAILEIIGARAVGSQEELRRLMLQRGWDVTQATLSRDLRDLRVARMPGRGGARYTVTDAVQGARVSLEAILPQLFVHADGVGELIVLRTVIGGAQPAALALDGEGWSEVLGTIAGDDTVLIICRSAGGRQKVLQRLRDLGRQ